MKQKELVERLKEKLKVHIAELVAEGDDPGEEYGQRVERAESIGDLAYICRDLCWDIESFLCWCLDEVLEDKVVADIPLNGWST